MFKKRTDQNLENEHQQKIKPEKTIVDADGRTYVLKKPFFKNPYFWIILVLLLAVMGKGEDVKDSKEYMALEEDLDKTKSELLIANKKIDEAKPWFDLSKAEQERKKEELAQQQAQKEAEEAAKVEAEKAAQEAEAKKGYETGTTYDQLARTPDNFIGSKVKFMGKVIQVIEAKDETQIRIAINSNYDNVILAGVPKSLTANSRILENDVITVYGTSIGLYSYKSTLGTEITIPAIVVDKFE